TLRFKPHNTATRMANKNESSTFLRCGQTYGRTRLSDPASTRGRRGIWGNLEQEAERSSSEKKVNGVLVPLAVPGLYRLASPKAPQTHGGLIADQGIS